MTTLEIQGGIPLKGTISVAGNKNAALPMIAAALLTDKPVVLDNVPDIGDVRTMMDLVANLGADVTWEQPKRRLTITAATVRAENLDHELSASIRASVLLVAPLLHRCGKVTIPPPGGDVIGRRRLDSHFEGLRGLGAVIESGQDFAFRADSGLTGTELFLSQASVTGTEQLLCAAVLAKGRTTIRNAACEPHVTDLARMLVGMGASIEGIGSNVLHIEGVERLGGTKCRVSSDFAEAGSFLALGAATKGDVTVTGIDPDHYHMTLRAFAKLGIRVDVKEDTLRVGPDQLRTVQPDPWGGMPMIDDGIWPQFPSDLMSVMLVLATQVHGTSLFFEKLYESRMYFVDRLIAMGANALICDPHRVVVCGPSQLHGITLSSPDIRAGIALLGAALCASGQSIISNVHLIDRGYEAIDERLRDLGAQVIRHSLPAEAHT